MSNFFRKDLNLQQKRLHRLLSIIFFIGFFVFLFIICKSFLFEGGFRPIYEAQSSLNDRITQELKLVSEFTNPGERIDQYPYGVNIFLFGFYGEGKYQGLIKKADDLVESHILNETFCSTNLYNQLNEVTKRTGIYKFYIREINNYSEPVSKNTASEYIKNNNIKCISIDRVYNDNFLNPGIAQEYQNNYYFYKKTLSSNFLKVIEILTGIVMIGIILSIPFSILILIYYKIILYVIYGKVKNENRNRK